MFISISCLQLSHFAEISGPYIRWQHRLAGPSGVYYCGQTSLNYNTSTTPKELYRRTVWILSSISSSAPALFTNTFYLWQNPFQAGGIHPGHHHYKRNMEVILCDVGWMNDGSNCAYMTVLTPKKPLPMLLKGSSSWEPDLHFLEDIILAAAEFI